MGFLPSFEASLNLLEGFFDFSRILLKYLAGAVWRRAWRQRELAKRELAKPELAKQAAECSQTPCHLCC